VFVLLDHLSDVFLQTLHLLAVFVLQGLHLLIGFLLVFQGLHFELLQLEFCGAFFDLQRVGLFFKTLKLELTLS
jgi:hypothetical protein